MIEITDAWAKWLVLAGFLALIFGPGLAMAVGTMLRQRRVRDTRTAPHGYEALHAQGVDTLRTRRSNPAVPAATEPEEPWLDTRQRWQPRAVPIDRSPLRTTWVVDELGPDLDPQVHPWRHADVDEVDELARGGRLASTRDPSDPRWRPLWEGNWTRPEGPDDEPPGGPSTLHDLRPIDRRLGDW